MGDQLVRATRTYAGVRRDAISQWHAHIAPFYSWMP